MIIGQTRFSLFIPDSKAWRATKGAKATEEYRRYLYNPARLDQRTEIFLTHTVPTLQLAAEKVASEHDVIHVVSFSESLPQTYKDQLEEAAGKYSVLCLEELPDTVAGGSVIVEEVKSRLKPREVFGRYRLDDDDILSTNYFQMVSKYVKDEYVGMMVSLPLGIEAVLTENEFFNPREAHVPMNSMGLLSICQLQENGTIKQPEGGPHDRSDRNVPVILDARGLGYLRAVHPGQDNVMRYSESNVLDNLLENLGKFPPVNSMEVVYNNFPTVAKRTGKEVKTDRPLTDGVAIKFETPLSGVGLRIKGDGLLDSKAQNVAVTYLFTDINGKPVPEYRNIPGIAASPNKRIGFFQYLPANGKFASCAGIYLPDDIKVSAVRIMPLNEEAKKIWIDSVEIIGATDFFSIGAQEYGHALEESQRGLKKRATAALLDNRERLYSGLERRVGARRALTLRRTAQGIIRKIRN